MPKYGQYDVPSVDTMVNFATGQPNNLNLPIEWFQMACAKMSTDFFGSSEDEHKQLLQYGSISGYDDIKQKMAEWLTEKYYNNLSKFDLQIEHLIHPNQIFMTNGNTGALHMLISKYNKANDYIIVENPTYFIALNIFKEYNLNIEGVNIEPDGVNLNDLENTIININNNNEQATLFYYMIPTHHNPTGITTTHEKRKKLAELCNKYNNLYIIADEVYHFLTFSSTFNYYPMADYHCKMISLGSFSKILAPALRVGWIYQNNKERGLLNSAVLDSSGGMNPIGYKLIEYALNKLDNIRPIDEIINRNIEFLQFNRNIMLEYLAEFDNIDYIRPYGGYFLWIKLNTINDSTKFLKFCEKYKVKFNPGSKFATDSKYFNEYIRLSFSYYLPNDLVVGLERLYSCIIKYNLINVKINGESGRLGSLIKTELLKHNNINYLGGFKRQLNNEDFRDLEPYNSVIIDVSTNEATFNLLTYLIVTNNCVPLIIGTTGLTTETMDQIHYYSHYAPVAHITNFSEGILLFKKIAQLSNSLGSEWKFTMTDIHHIHKKDAPSGTALTICTEIDRDVPIKSMRVGEVIGTHVLEITNDSELIRIYHGVKDRSTFAKGCINYIYWILNKDKGFYNKID